MRCLLAELRRNPVMLGIPLEAVGGTQNIIGRLGLGAVVVLAGHIAILLPGKMGREGVGGVAVEVVPGPVVSAGGARVGVAGGVLDVAQAHPGVHVCAAVCRNWCGCRPLMPAASPRRHSI